MGSYRPRRDCLCVISHNCDMFQQPKKKLIVLIDDGDSVNDDRIDFIQQKLFWFSERSGERQPNQSRRINTMHADSKKYGRNHTDTHCTSSRPHTKDVASPNHRTHLRSIYFNIYKEILILDVNRKQCALAKSRYTVVFLVISRYTARELLYDEVWRWKYKATINNRATHTFTIMDASVFVSHKRAATDSLEN